MNYSYVEMEHIFCACFFCLFKRKKNDVVFSLVLLHGLGFCSACEENKKRATCRGVQNGSKGSESCIFFYFVEMDKKLSSRVDYSARNVRNNCAFNSEFKTVNYEKMQEMGKSR